MKERGVIVGPFFPADGETAGAVEPTEGALDVPSAGLPSGSGLGAVLATSAQV